MNSAFSLLASYLVNSVWEVALIGGAGWLVSRSVKPLGPQAQHVSWVATLVLSIMAPATPFYFVLLGNVYPASNLQAHSVMMASTASVAVVPANSGIVLPPWLMLLLSLLYLGAFFFFAIRLGWLLHRAIAVIRRATPAGLGQEYEQLWQRSKSALRVQNATLLYSAEVPVLLLLVC